MYSEFQVLAGTTLEENAISLLVRRPVQIWRCPTPPIAHLELRVWGGPPLQSGLGAKRQLRRPRGKPGGPRLDVGGCGGEFGLVAAIQPLSGADVGAAVRQISSSPIVLTKILICVIKSSSDLFKGTFILTIFFLLFFYYFSVAEGHVWELLVLRNNLGCVQNGYITNASRCLARTWLSRRATWRAFSSTPTSCSSWATPPQLF